METVADAEGEANRFLQILTEYERAPVVTRQRLYLETIEEVLSNSTKVLMDTDGTGNNMIYLPLDRLMERRGSETPPTSYAAPGGNQPSSNNSDSLARLRARESR